MKKPLNIEIGARVRKARERLHMSRDVLSELLNISALFLGYIECGQKGMSTETLIRVCNTLHVSADYILLGREPTTMNRNKAEALLRDIPDAYYPLAEEALRLLLRTVATAQAECMPAHADKTSKNLRIAARSGDHLEMGLTPQREEALNDALAKMKAQPKSFSD